MPTIRRLSESPQQAIGQLNTAKTGDKEDPAVGEMHNVRLPLLVNGERIGDPGFVQGIKLYVWLYSRLPQKEWEQTFITLKS